MNAEERRALMEEALENMTHRLAEWWGILDQNRAHQNRTNEDRSLRVDVAEFTGQSLNPEEYIDWDSNIENYFEYRDTPFDRQYKMAKVKLTKLAATWLEGVQRQRVREGKGKIDSWEKLKEET